jgi:hypothetical protein
MKKEDIRWRQRFHNFQKAFQLLESAVLLAKERPLTELEEQGLIQRFEFTHELAWNLIKDYFITYQSEKQLKQTIITQYKEYSYIRHAWICAVINITIFNSKLIRCKNNSKRKK